MLSRKPIDLLSLTILGAQQDAGFEGVCFAGEADQRLETAAALDDREAAIEAQAHRNGQVLYDYLIGTDQKAAAWLRDKVLLLFAAADQRYDRQERTTYTEARPLVEQTRQSLRRINAWVESVREERAAELHPRQAKSRKRGRQLILLAGDGPTGDAA